MKGPATPDQLTKLVLLFEDHGLDREHRADRLRLCSEHAGRRLTSSRQLTKAQAHSLIERLESLPAGVDLLAAAERNKVTAGAPTRAKTPPRPAPTGSTPPAQPGATRPERTVTRHDPGCNGRGGHTVPAGTGVRYCACRGVADVPPKDRTCPPAVCYCGTCPWWKPAPEVNYAAAIQQLAEKTERRSRR